MSACCVPGLLIADDETIVRSAVKSILKRNAGLDIGPVGEAGSGEEAISMARQMRPNIVLMDVKMPGLNGLEAARTIRSEFPHTKIIMLTAYDEFTYSQDALRLGAVDYLLKPVRPADLIQSLNRAIADIEREAKTQIEAEQVSHRLMSSLPLVEGRLVQDLVNGTISAATAWDRITSHLGKTLSYPTVMLVDIDHFRQAVQGMDSEKYDRFCTLLTDIVRRASPDPERTLVGQVRPGIIAVVMSTPEDAASPSDLRAIGHAIRHTIEANAPVTATIGIGTRGENLAMIPASYADALRAQWYKIRFGRNSVIHIEDLARLGREQRPYPIELEQGLINSIRSGEHQASEVMLEEMITYLLENLSDPPEMTRTLFMELVVLISRAVIQAGAKTNEILRLTHNQIGELNLLKTGSEMRNWVINSMAEQKAKLPRGDRGDRLVDQAIVFMQENLEHPGLMLKDVADAVHISPSHLAHLLKEKTGLSYVKYLTSLRIEKAKHLLATTDQTIAAVAVAAGYDDSIYFHRIFRRETQMTPMAFRQSARSANRTLSDKHILGSTDKQV